MALGRPLFALLSLFFLAGGLLLILLTFLAGISDHLPLDKIYFLQADTSGISGAPAVSRWTFWNLCSVSSSGYNVCGKVNPAFPLDPPSTRNFGTSDGVPTQFIGTREYFFLTRFMFAFALIGLFFGACALFTGLLALCSRIGSYLSGLLGMIALFWQTLTSALMTAAYVKGRNNFISAGDTATLGRYAFGFMWAGVACFFLSSALFCLAGKMSKDHSHASSGGRFGFGRRNKSVRSARRGSFVSGTKDDFA